MNFFQKIFAPKPLANKYYVCICCIIKDENGYLEEWISYHRKIGVEHFYVYDNGSSIPIADTIESLGLPSFVTVNTIKGKAKQVKAYGDCIKRYGKASQWIGFIDVDEFIVPKTAHGDLPAFLKDYEEYGGLGVNWLIFGAAGHRKKTNRPQLESFTLRSEESFHVNRHIKSIVQPRFVKSSSNAHSFTYKEGKFCVNENFERIDASVYDNSVKKIQLNHYFCRSVEEFEEKMKRGIADTRKGRTMDQFTHHDQDANKVEDTTILEILKHR